QAEDGIRDGHVTGVQTCALPIWALGALALVFLYLFIGLAPLSLMIFGSPPRPRPFLVELSVALGFVGLSMLGLQFALVARFRSRSEERRVGKEGGARWGVEQVSR